MQKLFLFLLFALIISFSQNLFSQDINPGDGVRITFYNISDPITGDYFSQQDGAIQLPYIGIIETDNRDFASIREEITSKYNELYKNPELTVQPLYKISIYGEVRAPGIYYVTGVEKLSDVIALAGGETLDANLNKIYFVRRDERIDINAKEFLEKGNPVSVLGLKSGDQIYVPRRWWVVRNVAIIISAAAVVVTMIAILKD